MRRIRAAQPDVNPSRQDPPLGYRGRMRYLLRTGLFSAISTGWTLLRGSRGQKFTWRAVLAWVSWAITLSLAIGAVKDMRRLDKGLPVSDDSPFAPKPDKKELREKRRDEVKRISKRR